MTVTRFAPSPSGYLHIGSARTALFNWLTSRKDGGKFLLRIEDTDSQRLQENALSSILDSMLWLGITWDGETVFQSLNKTRHQEVAHSLVEKGAAYYCYMSKEEIEDFHQLHPTKKLISPWSAAVPPSPIKDRSPVIRLRVSHCAHNAEYVSFTDTVRGVLTVTCSELDDMILLRSDGTPTYMLAVVVDDHDMNISHVIRGDDHISNTFRQILIYNGMKWNIPKYTHIPLIHDMDGHKLSKRKGAISVEEYKKMGYLPEALRNYLIRLGWGGDGTTEIADISMLLSKFSIDEISKSPSRFDIAKLRNINLHYIKNASPQDLLHACIEMLRTHSTKASLIQNELYMDKLQLTINCKELVDRFYTLEELVLFVEKYILPFNKDAITHIVEENKDACRIILQQFLILLQNDNSEQVSLNEIKGILDALFILASSVKIQKGALIQCIRRSLMFGESNGPDIKLITSLLARSEIVYRVHSHLKAIDK
ncbi:Glutamate--tRNA ligase [Candidatus Fokinia solitaria]|uniref:Glutamate--tRNA ligase n=1 Tax=Candidatus Fokinia solitaria TaxID=1802984 RepID=A0A2U8BS57_9RICK|nr:glutamate--tRNA ligase [Candidatus Fokinia solitaria]AWD33196.1 Glutamate--tRNA ligase [Candidatus Fokinia solitaria]